MLRKMWDARQWAEAIEADQILRESHEVLFEQVRGYADQLQDLDSDAHNAAQEVSKVVLALSYAETAQERLDALMSEAQRLMLAVAEIKRQRADNTKLLTKLRHLAPYAESLFYALLCGGCVLLIALIAEAG
jgi:conjugal transfer/entry exclusion protein